MPLPRPIARGAGHPYPGPGGSGCAGGLGRHAAFGVKPAFAKMGSLHPRRRGCPGGLLPLDPHSAGLQTHSEQGLAQDGSTKAWNIPPPPHGEKFVKERAKLFLSHLGRGRGGTFPRGLPHRDM